VPWTDILLGGALLERSDKAEALKGRDILSRRKEPNNIKRGFSRRGTRRNPS
jgi:hypothetical protein